MLNFNLPSLSQNNSSNISSSPSGATSLPSSNKFFFYGCEGRPPHVDLLNHKSNLAKKKYFVKYRFAPLFFVSKLESETLHHNMDKQKYVCVIT